MIKRQTAKDYLTQSAIELFSKEKIEKITVKEICANCGLSTRTFYKYYKDKYDLMNNCFENEIENYFASSDTPKCLYTFLLFSANVICERSSFFSNVFCYTGQNNIRQGLEVPIRKQYIKIIQEYFYDDVTLDVYNAITFFIKGQLAYVEESIRKTEIPSAEASVEYFINAIPFCLVKYLYPVEEK